MTLDTQALRAAQALDLKDLRAEIDRVDDAILDLLVQRQSLTVQVGKVKQAQGPWLRLKPDREAEVLSRLLARAAPPARTLIRAVWREIMSAGLAEQQQLEVVVWTGGVAPQLMGEARRRFGAHPVYRLAATPEEALAAAEAGPAIAVLGLTHPWWTRLAEDHPDLWAFEMIEAVRADEAQALAVGRIDPASLAEGPVLRAVQGGDAAASLAPTRLLHAEGQWSLRAEAQGPAPTPQTRNAGVIGRAPALA